MAYNELPEGQETRFEVDEVAWYKRDGWYVTVLEFKVIKPGHYGYEIARNAWQIDWAAHS